MKQCESFRSMPKTLRRGRSLRFSIPDRSGDPDWGARARRGHRCGAARREPAVASPAPAESLV